MMEHLVQGKAHETSLCRLVLARIGENWGAVRLENAKTKQRRDDSILPAPREDGEYSMRIRKDLACGARVYETGQRKRRCESSDAVAVASCEQKVWDELS